MKNLLYSFVPKIGKSNLVRKNTVHHLINPAIGLDIGIPLNMLQNIFTNLHYGHDVSTTKLILLQFLIGYYTYGKDRFKDAEDNNKYDIEVPEKKDQYDFLIKNKGFYKSSYFISSILIGSILLFDSNFIYNIPFLLFLYTSEYYKELKTKYPYFKPFYISIMWTLSTVILPSVLIDHNYSILSYPLDYLPCMFNILGLSNIADIKDIEEDRQNNINTLPVKYGKEYATIFSLFFLFLSSLTFGLNENYLDRPIVNSLFEIQNAALSIIPIISFNKTID